MGWRLTGTSFAGSRVNGSRSQNLNLCDGHHILGAVSRIVCRYRIWEMTMRLIRFAIGMSLVAVSVLGSARAQSPAELSQVSGQEALTNRFSLRFRKWTGSVIASSSTLIFLLDRTTD